MLTSNQDMRSFAVKFRDDFAVCWRQVPDKGFFFALLAAWLMLFQFLGNSTLGYVHTPSLFGWLYENYTQDGSEDGHGLFVPLIVAVLFWIKRKAFAGVTLRWWPPALLWLGLSALMHLAGFWIQQPRLSVLAMLLGIYSLIGLVWGPAVMRRSLFPFLLFGFCIPMGSMAEPISVPLRLLVSKIVVFITNTILGMNVIQDGTTLTTSSGQPYEVAAACSGLRSLIATFLVAIVYAWLSFRTFGQRMILVLAAFPLAVAGNVLRLLIIVLASEVISPELGPRLHNSEFFNLLPYIAVFLGLFLVGRWLEKKFSMAPKLNE